MDLHYIILYVSSQADSEAFYRAVLNASPTLSVPGMTEFSLGGSLRLGLMPNDGIARIIGSDPHPDAGTGIPRCELYFKSTDAKVVINRAIDAGAKLIDDLKPRDWGDSVAYLSDPDGHILALAQ